MGIACDRFFFQAEDGIRDIGVTGVQTCALPIWTSSSWSRVRRGPVPGRWPGRRPDVRVLELWRYPVKSLQGERLATAQLGPLGIPGDRRWALFDRDTGLGLTARRVPELLFGAARVRPDGGVEVVLPDGTVTTDDSVISGWLGRRVELREATDDGEVPVYETPADEDVPDPTEWLRWEGASR